MLATFELGEYSRSNCSRGQWRHCSATDDIVPTRPDFDATMTNAGSDFRNVSRD
jgi:hypothetical protein